jgi:hypothetical protein
MWARNLDMVHYRFWRDFANAERDEVTMIAHRTLFEARKAYAEGRGYDSVDADGKVKVSEAQVLLEDAMNRWVAVFDKYPHMLIDSSAYLEEALLSVFYWLNVHETNGTTPPADFPLKALWEAHPDKRSDLQREFLLDTMRSRK